MSCGLWKLCIPVIIALFVFCLSHFSALLYFSFSHSHFLHFSRPGWFSNLLSVIPVFSFLKCLLLLLHSSSNFPSASLFHMDRWQSSWRSASVCQRRWSQRRRLMRPCSLAQCGVTSPRTELDDLFVWPPGCPPCLLGKEHQGQVHHHRVPISQLP